VSHPTRSTRTTRPARLRGDDGAALVELALVLPLLTMLVLGIFEFGTAWHDRTILTTALRGGARVESQSPAQSILAADYYSMLSFYATAGQMKNATLVKVIVFKGTSMPAACLAVNVSGTVTASGFGVSGSCNVYNLNQFNQVVAGGFAHFGCPATGVNAPGWDSNWCVSARNDSGTPDYVGMYAQYSYTPVTRLISGTITMTDTAIYRIEPNA
jgi:Flp pilus assembly protein TadG